MNMDTESEPIIPEETQHTEAGQETGKTFTQEEVNRIIADRIKREREKAEKEHAKALEELSASLNHDIDSKVAELNRRENVLLCREYLLDNDLPAGLLDIIPTDNVDEFKKKANKAREEFVKTPVNLPPLKSTESHLTGDSIKKAFDNPMHNPKKY